MGTLQEPLWSGASDLPFSGQMARMFVWGFFIVAVAFHHLFWKCKSCYSKPFCEKTEIPSSIDWRKLRGIQQKPPFSRQHLLPVLSQKTEAAVHEVLWIAGDLTWWPKQMHISLWIFICFCDFYCVLSQPQNLQRFFWNDSKLAIKQTLYIH